MPKTSVHAIFSFVVASTLARVLLLPPIHVLLAGSTAAILDYIIDLGHEGNRRSAFTHSVTSLPAILIVAQMVVPLIPLIPECGLSISTLTSWFWILFAVALGHLFWDSLTTNGVHIPLIGWTSLASLDSKGVVANLPPTLTAILIVYIFWMV